MTKGGSSTNPCAEDFQGHNPFEVPCTAAITKYVASFPKGEVIAYFDFHSYSQLWLYPYGYNCGLKIPEFDIVDRASQIAISAIAKVSGTRYTEGPICTTIYKASGSSTDHMYAMGVPFSFGVELRDKGRHGFMLRKLLNLIL
jgi:carboxypeptidase A1